MKKISILFLGLVASLGLMAQEAEVKEEDNRITTDRPTFGRSAQTIGRGLQLEVGATYNWLDDDNAFVKTDRADVFNGLLRLGLSKDFEFRIGISNQETILRSWTTDAKDKYNTWSPMEIGIKARFIDKEKFAASMLFNLYVRNTVRNSLTDAGVMVPGALVNRPNFVAPEMAFLFSHDWGKFNLDYNIGLLWNGQRQYTDESGAENPDWYYTVTAGFDIAKWLVVFVDHAAYMRNFHYPDVLIQGGLLVPIGENFQIDVRGGAGLNDFSQAALVGGGISWGF